MRHPPHPPQKPVEVASSLFIPSASAGTLEPIIARTPTGHRVPSNEGLPCSPLPPQRVPYLLALVDPVTGAALAFLCFVFWLMVPSCPPQFRLRKCFGSWVSIQAFVVGGFSCAVAVFFYFLFLILFCSGCTRCTCCHTCAIRFLADGPYFCTTFSMYGWSKYLENLNTGGYISFRSCNILSASV